MFNFSRNCPFRALGRRLREQVGAGCKKLGEYGLFLSLLVLFPLVRNVVLVVPTPVPGD